MVEKSNVYMINVQNIDNKKQSYIYISLIHIYIYLFIFYICDYIYYIYIYVYSLFLEIGSWFVLYYVKKIA